MAERFADVAGIGPPTEYGHSTQVETGNGATLDFDNTNGTRIAAREPTIGNLLSTLTRHFEV